MRALETAVARAFVVLLVPAAVTYWVGRGVYFGARASGIAIRAGWRVAGQG